MDSLERGIQAIVEDTQEPYTDVCISNLVSRGCMPQANDFVQKNLSIEHISAHEAMHLSRLERVAPIVARILYRINEDPRFEGRSRTRFLLVLELALKLHIDDADRADGTGPFVSHVLAVTEHVLGIYPSEDLPFVAMAALLHDAIEDQATLLAIEKRLAPRWNEGLKEEEMERMGAIESLGHFIGLRSRMIVEGVTTPLHDKKALPSEEKNNIYKVWAQDIVSDNANPARFVIKWADWRENAFTLQKILASAQAYEDAGVPEEAQKRMQLYTKLRAKYGPVLTDVVLPFLKSGMNENHPLWEQRHSMLAELEEVLRTQYV